MGEAQLNEPIFSSGRRDLGDDLQIALALSSKIAFSRKMKFETERGGGVEGGGEGGVQGGVEGHSRWAAKPAGAQRCQRGAKIGQSASHFP